MMEPRQSRTDLAAFAQQLRPLVKADGSASAGHGDPPFISAFVSRQRERIDAFSTPVTGLVVVIQGRKQVCWGGDISCYGEGDAFLLPAGARVDVVNELDEVGGTYRALFLRFPRDLVIEAARLWPEFVGSPSAETTVDLTPLLRAAILHAGAALAGASRRVVEHRLLEVVLLLAEQGAMRLAPKYAQGSVADAVRVLVRHRLDRDWSAAAVAEAFGMSEATLRRRLRQEEHSLRALLLGERMRAARLLLVERHAEVAEAAAATGYVSRSHFARHFRRAFAVSPAAARAGRGPPKAG